MNPYSEDQLVEQPASASATQTFQWCIQDSGRTP